MPCLSGRRGGARFVAEMTVLNDDLFARLIRRRRSWVLRSLYGRLVTTPDLMAFMDLLHDGHDDVYDGFPARR